MEKDIKKCGIYCWINKINNKRYIGQTGSKGGFSYRWKLERYCLNKYLYKRLNKHFCDSWKKYGAENFEVKILEIIENPTREALKNREQYWCDFYKSNDRKFGYNKRKCVESNLGIIYEEKSDKMKNRFLYGEANHASKLTLSEIKEIREKYFTGNFTFSLLAKMYNVGDETIRVIIYNLSWKDPYYNPPKHKKNDINRYKKYNLTEEKIIKIREDINKEISTLKQLSVELNLPLFLIRNIALCKIFNLDYLIPKNYSPKLGKICGERHKNAKLTAEAVIEIRKNYKVVSVSSLAKSYNVCETTIRSIINYKTWKHLKMGEFNEN